MDIKIIGKHIEVTDSIKEKIEDKISKFPKYYNNISSVEVILEGNIGGVSNSVEIIVRAKHNHVFVAKHTGDDIYNCVDDAEKKMERQLTKHKQKERDNKHTADMSGGGSEN
ncbi:MAG TPA: ribosome-associated translation inhibitor RaiA [Phycisphaerales bacterium]|nr:ribosome-associated translation inhibitor RaiA [Phycisphaerales bacterium]